MHADKLAKLNQKIKLKVNPERTIEKVLESCELDLKRVLKMNTPNRLSKIDLDPINSQFLQNNQTFIELVGYLRQWNNRVDTYRKDKQFFKCQNALNTIFIELGIHLREICQTFHRDIQLSYLNSVKKWFEEIYAIFCEEFHASQKKKQGAENFQDILDRIELAIASKINNNEKINEILQRKKKQVVDVKTPTIKSMDYFKKFLPRPQTVESNPFSQQVQKLPQQISSQQDSRPKNDSNQPNESTQVEQKQSNNDHHHPQSVNNQNNLKPINVIEYERKIQTCIPCSRAHSYGHIPLQQQVRFISKTLDEKTQFKLQVLKQKLNKEQEKKEQEQLKNFIQKQAKERRQLIQFKNSCNELTFQCNQFEDLKYQKKELQENLQDSILSQYDLLDDKSMIAGYKYNKNESFDSYAQTGQEDQTKNPSFLMQKSIGREVFDNENEDNLSQECINPQISALTPQLQKNRSQIEGYNQQLLSNQNSQYFKTASSFFPNNNQMPTMETFNQINSRISTSQHKTRNYLQSDTFYSKQKSKQEYTSLQSPQKVASSPQKQAVTIDLFGILEQKNSSLYNPKQGNNFLNTQNQITQEIKRNKINQLIQTKGKIINLTQKQLPQISQTNITNNYSSQNIQNELTEQVVKERLQNTIMQYSTKIKQYQENRRQINTKSKQSITDNQITSDQIDEINKIKNTLSKKNIKIDTKNLKASLISPILPVPQYKLLKNKSSFLPQQGERLFSEEED
ncbi:hypothetical protein TTHERM_00655920 (macronuclear) [Tetrahymena thermophila SB210]|uniref:Uncharacterized protein n=1 Tax=Tetrahymena thermophila (strain SB210) TaxID=312017 RepID=Q22GW4_TETTS|nr:hypothetical protein TTHERM_00655920 [Tetrahymena thermophila SB210]EAR84560.1 hypothetical protein TTHERM_00655920 [Tetrahymena thermophila SB210]|eukprot:XP_001032223.1 hypothetical protein TTHERM_00655920 [Tetrahymena thermophila SB210]